MERLTCSNPTTASLVAESSHWNSVVNLEVSTDKLELDVFMVFELLLISPFFFCASLYS